jgi:hypothetical protein
MKPQNWWEPDDRVREVVAVSLRKIRTLTAMPQKSIFRQPGAQHFQLVHRSQRDPLIHDPYASQHVFKPYQRENLKKVGADVFGRINIHDGYCRSIREKPDKIWKAPHLLTVLIGNVRPILERLRNTASTMMILNMTTCNTCGKSVYTRKVSKACS